MSKCLRVNRFFLKLKAGGQFHPMPVSKHRSGEVKLSSEGVRKGSGIDLLIRSLREKISGKTNCINKNQLEPDRKVTLLSSSWFGTQGLMEILHLCKHV